MTEQPALFDVPEIAHVEVMSQPLPAQHTASPDRTINPCLALYGVGPENALCGSCTHCRYRPQRNPTVRYWKCDLRTLTNGRATDHKVRWQACGRYEQRAGEYHGG